MVHVGDSADFSGQFFPKRKKVPKTWSFRTFSGKIPLLINSQPVGLVDIICPGKFQFKVWVPRKRSKLLCLRNVMALNTAKNIYINFLVHTIYSSWVWKTRENEPFLWNMAPFFCQETLPLLFWQEECKCQVPRCSDAFITASATFWAAAPLVSSEVLTASTDKRPEVMTLKCRSFNHIARLGRKQYWCWKQGHINHRNWANYNNS